MTLDTVARVLVSEEEQRVCLDPGPPETSALGQILSFQNKRRNTSAMPSDTEGLRKKNELTLVFF